MIYEDGVGEIAVCHTPNQYGNNCVSDTCQVTLQASHQYKMYVCLRRSGSGSCAECSEYGCTARGYVWIGGSLSTACMVAVCNP